MTSPNSLNASGSSFVAWMRWLEIDCRRTGVAIADKGAPERGDDDGAEVGKGE